jgi:cysteine desulfurase
VREVYLDNSATTQPYPQVIERMARMMEENYGNPSSLHRRGFQAEKEVSAARKQVADSLRCQPEEICFTGSGTEADNLALFGTARALRRQGNHILTTAVEHPAVLQCCHRLEEDGFQVDYIPMTSQGELDMEFALSHLRPETILCSIMLVNNELGSIFPVERFKAAMQAAGSRGLLHTDCVQAYGKLPFTPKKLGADLVTLSAHKIHGPKGVGALYIRKGVRLAPHLCGGGQERGLRSGTENTYGIVGFGAAVEETFAQLPQHIAHLRDLKEYTLSRLPEVENCVVNSPTKGAPHLLHLSLPGLRSEIMLHQLESMGIYVSSGSACSAKSHRASHVLTQAGLSDTLLDSALRISFGAFNTREDCDALIEGLKVCRSTLKEKR